MQSLLETCRGSGCLFSLQQKLVGGLCMFLEFIFLMAVCVKGLQGFVETVLTTVHLVARFWRFVDSVLTTQKPVRSM